MSGNIVLIGVLTGGRQGTCQGGELTGAVAGVCFRQMRRQGQTLQQTAAIVAGAGEQTVAMLPLDGAAIGVVAVLGEGQGKRVLNCSFLLNIYCNSRPALLCTANTF